MLGANADLRLAEVKPNLSSNEVSNVLIGPFRRKLVDKHKF